MKLLRLTQHDYELVSSQIKIGVAERKIAHMVLVLGMNEGMVSQHLAITRQRVNQAVATFSRKYEETGMKIGVVRGKHGVPHEMLRTIEARVERYLSKDE